MANGQVTTGFSKPYVAKYSHSGTTVSYSNGQALARGVDVTVSPETSGDNKFYADNAACEEAASKFTNGTITLTVDGLKVAAERLVFGLGTANSGWVAYDDTTKPPYVGVGFIARVQSDGVVGFVPTVIPKVVFDYMETTAATQEDEIDWQTQSLSAKIYRDDSANHVWKYLGTLVEVGTTYTTEALAEAAAETALKAKLGIS